MMATEMRMLEQGSDCTELLIDLVCYELQGHRLSPEMAGLLDEHLEECPSCRRKVQGFYELLEEPESSLVH